MDDQPNVSRAQMVYNWLKAQIRSGRFKPGQRLPGLRRGARHECDPFVYGFAAGLVTGLGHCRLQGASAGRRPKVGQGDGSRGVRLYDLAVHCRG